MLQVPLVLKCGQARPAGHQLAVLLQCRLLLTLVILPAGVQRRQKEINELCILSGSREFASLCYAATAAAAAMQRQQPPKPHLFSCLRASS